MLTEAGVGDLRLLGFVGPTQSRILAGAVASDAKVVPINIERRRFAEVRVEGFRLRHAA